MAQRNLYLETLLAPRMRPDQTVPDLNMTPSITKPLNISKTVSAVLANYELMVVFAPQSTLAPMKLFIRQAGTLEWYWLVDVWPSQQLAAKYRLTRLVSAIMDMESSSVSTTNASISGLMNLIHCVSTPPLNAMATNQLSSYASSGKAAKVDVKSR